MTDVTNVNTAPESSNESTAPDTSTNSVVSATIPDLKDLIPEDLKDEPSLANQKDVQSLIKSYVHSQKMLGSRIAIPSKDASEEARKEFYDRLTAVPGVVRIPDAPEEEDNKNLAPIYDKLGRPSTPDRYKLEIPEGLELDTNYLKSITETAHAVGLTQKQLKALADQEFKAIKAQVDASNKQKEIDQEFMRKEWGNAYEQNTRVASAVLGKFTEKYPEHVQALIASGAASNPVIRLLAVELGKVYKETGTIGLDSGTTGTGLTPDMALEKINEIKSNPKHAYFNKNDPAHEAAVARVNKLYQDAYPADTKK